MRFLSLLWTKPVARVAKLTAGVLVVSASLAGIAFVNVAMPLAAQAPGIWQQVAVFNNATGAFGTRDVVNDKNRPSDFYSVAQNGVPYLTKSVDFGQTWNKMTVQSGSGALSGTFGLAIAPSIGAGAATLYIGAGSGFWKSVDGGLNWTNFPIAPAPAGRPDVYAPAVDPYDANHLLMAAHEQSLLYQSINGGQTWVLAQIATGMASAGTAFPFFIDTGTAGGTRNNWMYTTQDNAGSWRTTNGGTTWTRVAAGSHRHGASQIYQPDSKGVVYAGGEFTALSRSTDYGLTWTQMWSQNTTGFSNTMTVVFGTPNNVYGEDAGASGCCGANGPAYATAPQPGTAGRWTAPAVPGGMFAGAGSAATAFDGAHWIIVTANWGAGLWRYVEPSAGGATPATASTNTPVPTVMPTSVPGATATAVPLKTATPAATPTAVTGGTCQTLTMVNGQQQSFNRPMSFCTDQ